MNTKKYIVAWTNFDKNIKDFSGRDHYIVFIDGDTSEENYEKAKDCYKKLIDKKTTAIASICEIIESTDY